MIGQKVLHLDWDYPLTENDISKQIITLLEEVSRFFFTRNDRTQLIYEGDEGRHTNKIKFELAKLAYKNDFCCYANKLLDDDLYGVRLQDIQKIICSKPCVFGHHKFRNTEWMFDVHWYKDVQGKAYMPETLFLASECEWHKKRDLKKRNRIVLCKNNCSRERCGGEQRVDDPLSGIKYDFQKLLVTNACLRLMIFRLDTYEELRKIDDYFCDSIECYKNLNPGNKFLFACYMYGKKPILHYARAVKC